MNTKSLDTLVSTIKKAGLTDSQAKGYLALIEHGHLSPSQLAEITGESRTNAYMICDKLETLGLATKKDKGKATYKPSHPSALEALAEKRRKLLTQHERDLKQNISLVVDLFYQHSELPGTRTLQGLEGIKTVYRDTLKTTGDIYFLRSLHDSTAMGKGFFDAYKDERAAKGITAYALTPQSEESDENTPEDVEHRMIRTLLPNGSYTAPVEIDIYDDKVAFIAFGETQMATIIDSPPVAEAMRQLFKIVALKQ